MFKRNIFIVFTLFITLTGLKAETYNIPEGYLINPVETSKGIIVTNEFESVIYLINGNKLEKLVESPGCGRYLSVSPDGTKIGFKLIDNITAEQSPAYFDLNSKSIVKLNEPVNRCGQVDFDAAGNIYYTIGQKLIRWNSNLIKEYDLGTYSNLTPVSPNGKYAIIKDNDDQLWLFDLDEESKELLTDNRNGYYNTSWSPDGQYISFQSINAKVFVSDIAAGQMISVGNGENPRWSNKSDEIIYFKREIEFNRHELVSSELYSFNLSGKSTKQITYTPEVFEMNPSFNKEGKVIYDTYGKNQIRIIDPAGSSQSSSTVFILAEPLENKGVGSIRKIRPAESPKDLDDWFHIHQVFDTRDSGPWTNHPQNGRHQGYLACGATTCMEALASYRILPPKPIYTYGRTSEYGAYISDEYEYDGYTYAGFTTTGDRPGFMTGAHGYMWNAGGSPSSNATQFLRNHGIDANRSDNPSWSAVKAEIDAGYPYVLCTISLTDGHIVLGIGQYGDGQTLYCNDPYGDKNAGSYGGIRNGRNAVYDWGDENTGHIKITPVVWGITARYDRTLPLVSCYPENGQTDVSPSSQVVLDFNNPLNIANLEEYVVIYDENYIKISVEYDYNFIADGKLIINPVEELAENSTYKIYIDYRTSSANGLQYEKNSEIEFKTGANRRVSGELLDNFENNSQISLVSYGVIDSLTGIQLTGVKSYEESASLEINYAFDNPNGSGYARVLYDPEISAGQVIDKYLGLWVFGDCSNNNLEVWLSKEDGNIACPLKVALNWSGWKFLSADLESVLGDDSVTLNSIAVRQSKGKKMYGKVYVDYLAVQDKLPEVASFNLSGLSAVELNEKLELVFTKPMNQSVTETAVTISPVTEGSFEWIGDQTLSFIPAGSLVPNTNYIVNVGIDAIDTYGNNIEKANEFSFKTKRSGLLLEDSYPENGMTGVSIDVKIILDFDEYIDRNTLYGNVVFTDADDNPVDIAVDASGYPAGKVMFEPAEPLLRNSTYKVKVNTGVRDTSGLQIPSDFEISFSTITEQYESGNILENFETVDNWIQPAESEHSIGVHNYVSKLTKYSSRKVNGEYSAKLAYKFTGVRGICNTKLTAPVIVDASGNVGLWINGDYSFNDFRFWFVGSNEEIIESKLVKLDWTGWKLVQVDLSEYTGQDIKGLHSINIVQTDSGSISNEILFDDLQTDIVLPVADETMLPAVFALHQNYPNPFNPTTTIEYTIPVGDEKFSSPTNVKLIIYDILGRKVTTLVNAEQKPGRYRVSFNASKLASGVYFYRLDAGDFRFVRKMIVMK